MKTPVHALPGVSNRRRDLLILGAIALVALVARLVPLARGESVWTQPDTAKYVALANGLRAGCGFAQWTGRCGSPELERTPGYPLFLAAAGNLPTAIVIQALLGAAICLLVGLYGWWRWGIAVGAIASLVLALDVPTILMGNSLVSETLFTAFLVMAILLLLVGTSGKFSERETSAIFFVSGCLVAAATLVRPIGEMLFLVIPPWLYFACGYGVRRTVWLSTLFLCTPAMVLLGWSYRNYRTNGLWLMSSQAAIQLYDYRAAGVVAALSGRSQADVLNEFSDRTGGWEPEHPKEMERAAIRIMISHPIITMTMTLKGIANNCFLPNRTDLANLLQCSSKGASEDASAIAKANSLMGCPSMIVLVVFQIIMLAFVWVGVVLALMDSRPAYRELCILLAIAALLILAAAGPEAYSRFRVPAIPIIAIVAAYGWVAASKRRRPAIRQSTEQAA
jgi:hypothetical protein